MDHLEPPCFGLHCQLSYAIKSAQRIMPSRLALQININPPASRLAARRANYSVWTRTNPSHYELLYSQVKDLAAVDLHKRKEQAIFLDLVRYHFPGDKHLQYDRFPSSRSISKLRFLFSFYLRNYRNIIPLKTNKDTAQTWVWRKQNLAFKAARPEYCSSSIRRNVLAIFVLAGTFPPSEGKHQPSSCPIRPAWPCTASSAPPRPA